VERFDRLFVATLMPYKSGTFNIDESALRAHLRSFLTPAFSAAGGGIIINPEAAEVFYLTREEKRRCVEIAMEECGGRLPVFAGAIDNTTEGTVQVAEDAKAIGVEGIFVIPPVGAMDITVSWNAEKYPDIWLDMVKAVDRAVDLPLIAHPVASLTSQYGIGLPLPAALRMVNEVPNFVGWKMTYSYDGYRRVAREFRGLDRHVSLLGAVAVTFHENLANDQFDGTVTGALCYALEPMIEHIGAWRRGDVSAANRIWQGGLAELHEYVYAEWTRLHIRYKIAAWLRGVVNTPLMRPPLPKPEVAEIVRLRELLARLGCAMIEAGEVDRTIAALGGEAPAPTHRRAA
jgi:4-hydroxy-tetrahydrodipicolinate synthase